MHTRLIVSGNVQGVGYRTLVRQIAKRMRVTGIIRNLENEDVEIYCQCSDGEILDKFIKQIEIKATTEDVFAVHVDSINSYKENEPEYGEPNTDFKRFIIDYGMDVDQFQRETLERSEIGILLLGGTRSDIKSMHSDLKEGFDRIEGSVDSMHTDLNMRFDTLVKNTASLVRMLKPSGTISAT